jgi:hypothetical protein
VDLSTTAADRAIHLVIYVVAAGALATVALGVLERLVDSDRRLIGLRHVLIALGAVALSIVVERLYHSLS